MGTFVKEIEPYYYKGERGNKPYPLELMLRIYMLQNLYDPDAHSAKKGNTWLFGYKMHIGVDGDSGLVHHVKTTSANKHDVTATSELMHGEEETLNGDSGYIGADKRPEAIRKNKHGKKIRYIINRKQSSINKLSKSDNTQQKRGSMKNHPLDAKLNMFLQ